MEYIFVCPKCGATFGSKDQSGRQCPDCKMDTIYTGFNDTDWYALPRKERDEKKKDIIANGSPELRRERELAKEREAKRAQARAELIQRKKTFLSTTTNSFEGYKITQYLKIESGEVVLGTGIFSEFSASFSDLLGTANASFGSKLEQAKSVALEKLKENCILDGANAVVGVDLDIMTIGSNMIVACANGTAVRIEKI